MLTVTRYGNKFRQVYYYPDRKAPKHIGSCSVYIMPNNVYEIWSLGLLGRFRGQGYGKKMVAELVHLYSRYGTVRLYVEKNNERAIHIYTQAGFRICGEYDGGTEAWKMEYWGQ